MKLNKIFHLLTFACAESECARKGEQVEYFVQFHKGSFLGLMDAFVTSNSYCHFAVEVD